MSKRKPTKVKTMSPAAIAAKQDAQVRDAVNDVAAAIGLPDAQSGHHAVAVVPALPDGWSKSHGTTLRKLTRVERLQRSGAIDVAQVAAIKIYVDAAEEAYCTGVKVAAYGDGGGGSSPTGAAAAEHERQWDRVGAGYRYQQARDAIPKPYVIAFERIVLDNHPISLVGAEMWPASSKGAVSGAVRALVQTCADALRLEFARELEAPPPTLIATMKRFDAAIRQERSGRPISEAIEERLRRVRVDETLCLSPAVLADLMRENGLEEQPLEWAGCLLTVIEHWQFGWLVQSLPTKPD